MEEKRGKFSSSIGFVLAATGAAVGLGNLWKFPYVAGENGGAVFLIFYLLFVLVLGVPIMLTEMAIGRKTRQNPIGAYKSLNKKFTFIGVIGVVTAFVILSYYSVIGGWVLKYISLYLTGAGGKISPTFFKGFISSPIEPVIWHWVFMALTCLIVIKGVSNGIEKASKIMLPALFIFIIILVIRSVTLPNAMEGIRYFFIPKFDDIDSFSKLSKIMLAAMGQVFFSLSLGMGALITYGSYLDKNENLQRSAVIIPTLDSIVAILAGLAVLPAVFAFGYKPSADPGMLFETLPMVFESMPMGTIFGGVFFILLFFAAITSAVSLLEVVTSYCIDGLKMKRKTASIIVAAIMGIIGTVASLSFGPMKDATIFGQSFFDLLGVISDRLLMPLGGLLMCIFVGHIWGIENAAAEITNNGELKFHMKKTFSIIMKYVAPAIIIAIFIGSFFV